MDIFQVMITKEIVTEYNCAYDIYTAYLIEHKDKISRKGSLESFINTLKETDELNLTFSNKLFIITIDKIVVNADYLEFCFKDGEIVRIEI